MNNDHQDHWNGKTTPRLQSHVLQTSPWHTIHHPSAIPTLTVWRANKFGDSIHTGMAALHSLDLDEATQLLLKNQQSKLQPDENPDHPLESEKLMNGYHKWPECTTTSPSGRHLGIYKSLLKDFPPTNLPPDYQPWTHGLDIMHMLFQLLQLVVKHTHIYSRWQVIWNMYLEKDPGNPHIDRLCALHLIEADLNLKFKWYSSQGFLKRSEKAQWLNDSQYGGRPGRSTIDLACKKMTFYDHFWIMQTKATDVSNDLAHCFDRMIEACQNLSCRQHGADLQYLKLHAAAHRQFHYHVKHTYRVSMQYNTFTDDLPWYGAGQGLGDVALRWVVQANSPSESGIPQVMYIYNLSTGFKKI